LGNGVLASLAYGKFEGVYEIEEEYKIEEVYEIEEEYKIEEVVEIEEEYKIEEVVEITMVGAVYLTFPVFFCRSLSISG
jgi:hypothetical protein